MQCSEMGYARKLAVRVSRHCWENVRLSDGKPASGGDLRAARKGVVSSRSQHSENGARYRDRLQAASSSRYSMRISVPTETAPRELRVALAPDSVSRLIKQQKLEVVVQRGAGLRAGFRDDAYESAGASIAADATATLGRRRTSSPRCSHQAPTRSPGWTPARRCCRCCARATAPRSPRRSPIAASTPWPSSSCRESRARSRWTCSRRRAPSSGYKGVLIGAEALGKFLPMLTTAAGNISPAKVFIIGAGVAGLQAIATARRLGGVVSAFDVRPAAREQVLSLGATFVANELVSTSAEAAGGYARAQTQDEQANTLAAIGNHIKDQDLVVTHGADSRPHGAAPDHQRDGRVDARRLGDRRPGRRDGRQLRAVEAR